MSMLRIAVFLTAEDGFTLIFISKNEVSHDFEDEIMAAFSVCGNIKIDLSETTHISSLAMKALLSVQQIIDDILNELYKITGKKSPNKKFLKK